MPARTAVGSGGGDWKKIVGALLAANTIYRIVRQPRIGRRDWLQLAAAIGFFLG